jgi:hypothetical protein
MLIRTRQPLARFQPAIPAFRMVERPQAPVTLRRRTQPRSMATLRTDNHTVTHPATRRRLSTHQDPNHLRTGILLQSLQCILPRRLLSMDRISTMLPQAIRLPGLIG